MNIDIDSQIKSAGLNPTDFTESQKWLMTEPSNGPEIFYMDGEVSRAQALKYWKTRLLNSGLTKEIVKKAVKMNFG